MADSAASIQLRQETIVSAEKAGFSIRLPVEATFSQAADEFRISYYLAGDDKPRAFVVPSRRLLDRREFLEREFPWKWGDPVV